MANVHNMMRMVIGVALLATFLLTGCAALRGDPLPSWNDGPAKQSITSFVQRVTTPGNKDFVQPAERIAVFDNDGTLWAEQPIYFQFAFAIDRVQEMAPAHPQWKTQDPFKSILEGNLKAALSGGEKTVMALIAATHSGMTTDEFAAIVKEWAATARHPTLNRLYTQCTYLPMVEVLDYLRDNGFKTFIVSGGGIEFMRPWVEQAYGVPPEQVVGSSGKTKFEMKDGVPVLIKLPEIGSIDDKDGKPININLHIGRHPIIAFGNSDGDQQMLEWTAANKGPSLCVLVHHTDAVREWAYDRTSEIGRLNVALDAAKANGWTLIDMKSDWRNIFSWE